MKLRNFQKIADKIIEIIEKECTFDEERKANIIEQIDRAKKNNHYKAPEFQCESWIELSKILSNNFVPSHSKFETKLMIVFNDLKNTIDNYWDDEKNELRKVN